VTEHEQVGAVAERDAGQREMRLPQNRATPPTKDGARIGYQEYDLLLRASPPRALTIVQQIIAVLVRLMGISLLVVGIATAVFVIYEVWVLYEHPERIERFSTAIEKGSNLDTIFALGGSEISGTVDVGTATEDDAAVEAGASAETAAQPVTVEFERTHLRLSYFAAWFLVLLLLFVMSVVAVSAVSAGGRLALYDTDVRQLSRAVIKEIRRGRAESKTD
jgi:hypothetical protein